jgi:WD40 repeat protein
MPYHDCLNQFNNNAFLWDVKSGNLTDTLPNGHTDYMHAAGPLFIQIAASADGTRVLTTSDEGIHLWDASTHKEITLLKRQQDYSALTQTAVFSPDSKRIIDINASGTIRLSDAVTGRSLAVLPNHFGGSKNWFVSPNGAYIVSNRDRETSIWNAVSGQLIKTIKLSYYGVAKLISNDGKHMVFSGSDCKLYLVELATEKQVVSQDACEWSFRLFYSPNNALLVTDKLEVVSAATGKLLTRLDDGLDSDIFRVVFSPDGKLLASIGNDGVIRLWGVPKGF